MTPVRKLSTAPPPPASHTRTKAPPRTLAELRLDAHLVLARADVEAAATRTEADARRDNVLGDRDPWATLARRSADRLDAAARALQDDAEELRWLAGLGA